MVIDYKTLESYSALLLDEMVVSYLEDGWQPQGGISVSVSVSDRIGYNEQRIYAQAMVLIARRSQIVRDTQGLSVTGG